jgi:6,7-dimethyl-8-ribityllumazine synthase
VIQGDTDHYQYVCQQVSYGCQQVMLTYNIPVIFGVLTVQTEEQAISRIGGSHGHKGREAALAAIQMVQLAKEF